METTELRKQLLEYISNADEKLLKEVEALVENYETDQLVTHSVQGKPLNREEMQHEIAEAEAEYKKGEYTSHDQLKEEIKNWKK